MAVIKGIVFDMDGVMFDTERLMSQKWQQVAEQEGVEIPWELVLKTIGGTDEKARGLFDEYYRKTAQRAFPYEELRDRRVALVKEHIERYGMPVKPGLYELLDYVKGEGYPITVATSTEREKALYYFEKAGVRPYFAPEKMVCGDMIAKSKPDPEIYLTACRKLNLPPQNCIAVEDSLAGVQSAHAAGMLPVMIPDLILPTPEIEAMLFYKGTTLADVIKLLRSDKQ